MGLGLPEAYRFVAERAAPPRCRRVVRGPGPRPLEIPETRRTRRSRPTFCSASAGSTRAWLWSIEAPDPATAARSLPMPSAPPAFP